MMRQGQYDADRGKNFKVVIRVRPPLPRELRSDKVFQNVVMVDVNERLITVSENPPCHGQRSAQQCLAFFEAL